MSVEFIRLFFYDNRVLAEHAFYCSIGIFTRMALTGEAVRDVLLL